MLTFTSVLSWWGLQLLVISSPGPPNLATPSDMAREGPADRGGGPQSLEERARAGEYSDVAGGGQGGEA